MNIQQQHYQLHLREAISAVAYKTAFIDLTHKLSNESQKTPERKINLL